MKCFNFLLIIVFFTSALFSCLKAQIFSLRANVNYATFQMEDQKFLQDRITEVFSLNGYKLQTVKRFPAFADYQLQAVIPVSKCTNIGLAGGYTSTSGQLYFGEYTQEAKIDQIVKNEYLGFHFETLFDGIDYFDTYVTFQAVYNIETLEIEEAVRILSASAKQKLEYSTKSVSFQPGLAVEFPFGNFFTRLGIAYNLNIDTRLEKYIYSQWSGLRMGVTMGYNFM